MIGLYIHIPYCVQKCAYCDFVSFASCEVDKATYAQAVCREIEYKRRLYQHQSINTIYFGGGTPTLMPACEIKRMMQSIKQTFHVSDNAEITMEGNPDTFDFDYLKAVQAVGVNRLSMGVQSLQDDQLKMIGRIHTAEQALKAIDIASKAGFKNISVDLMLGLPKQTAKTVSDDVKQLVNRPITHISAYELKLEPRTKLTQQVKDGRVVLPAEDEVVSIDTVVRKLLAEHGLIRYEISNYAKQGYQSQHNLKYWHNEEYLGVGCGAHSRMGNVRFANTIKLKDYIKNSDNEFGTTFSETITVEQSVIETIMLGLRLTKGLNVKHVKEKLGVDLLKQCEDPINRFQQQGLLKLKGTHLILTERGMDLQNTVLMSFME